MRALLCVGLLLIAACREAPEPRVQGTVATETEPAPALPDPPPGPDPYAKEYQKAAAMLRYWEGDPRQLEAARATLTSILAKDRDYAPAYAALARLEMHAGARDGIDYDPAALERAAKFASHAVKLSPSSFDAYLAAGTIATEQKEFNRARDALGVADGLKKHDAEVQLARAALASAEANPPEMLRHAQEVLTASKDSRERAAAYRFVAQAYEEGGHNDAAETAYREMVRLRPRSAAARSALAQFLLRRADVGGAIREAEESVRLVPSSMNKPVLARAYLARADLLSREGRWAEAAAEVERVTLLSPESAVAWSSAGSFYERAFRRIGDRSFRERAIASYRRATAIDSTNAEASEGVMRLGGS